LGRPFSITARIIAYVLLCFSILVIPQLLANHSPLVSISYVGNWQAVYSQPQPNQHHQLSTRHEGREIHATCLATDAGHQTFDCRFSGSMEGYAAIWSRQLSAPGLAMTLPGEIKPDVRVSSVFPPLWLGTAQVLVLLLLLRLSKVRVELELKPTWVPWILLPLAISLSSFFLPVGSDSFLETVEELFREQPWLVIGSVCVMAPIVEELVFRGIGWRILRPALGDWGTLSVTTISFTILHVAQYQLAELLVVFMIGLSLGLIRKRFESVVPCVIAHALVNATALVIMSFQ